MADPGLDNWTLTVNYGDGTGWQTVVLATNHTFTLSHTYADSGNYTVTVQATDGDGGSDVKTLPVVVLNVAPTATLSNAGDVTEGTVGVAAVSFTNRADVSGVDATSLRFAYDFAPDAPCGASCDDQRAAWIACQTRAGVAGMSMCVMPRPDKASTTALITAAVEPTAPASPAPLTPSGLVVHGYGCSDTAKGGTWCARGMP